MKPGNLIILLKDDKFLKLKKGTIGKIFAIIGEEVWFTINSHSSFFLNKYDNGYNYKVIK